ncbi:MAG TPA: DUF4330 family protein [Candidatus Nanoarchaeia archaeon]|nr:DUF4330 family protein [Candidatus Nanoarchaeia archaeon]
MQWIDTKGRIFGTLNIIDAVVLCVAVLLLLGYLTFAYLPDVSPATGQRWTITLRATHADIASAVHIGDSEMQSNLTIATVKNIRQESGSLYLDLEVMVSEPGSDTVGKKGPIKVGMPMTFEFPNSIVTGIVISGNPQV